MPRSARKKSSESTYHVMNRSISEVDLFRSDEDKEYYLDLLQKYTKKFSCSIYAYCLMDNHVHLYINPNGFDISRFMHCLNCAYVIYYNKKYSRHGHLYQGRFASNIVTSNAYSLTLTAYIHNNPKDIEGYRDREEDYEYSSYGIYIGKRIDKRRIVDTDYVLNLFSADKIKACKKYYEFTKMLRGTEIIEEIDEDIMKAYCDNEYRSEKRHVERNINPEKIIKVVCESEGEKPEKIKMKYSRESSKLRALIIYGMRILCGYTLKNICEYIGDMSLSGIKRLSDEGYKLYINSRYSNIFNPLNFA
jgi:REP element-mobilizing transposase RayT